MRGIWNGVSRVCRQEAQTLVHHLVAMSEPGQVLILKLCAVPSCERNEGNLELYFQALK